MKSTLFNTQSSQFFKTKPSNLDSKILDYRSVFVKIVTIQISKKIIKIPTEKKVYGTFEGRNYQRT